MSNGRHEMTDSGESALGQIPPPGALTLAEAGRTAPGAAPASGGRSRLAYGGSTQTTRNLPAELASRFTVERELSATGGEADLFVVGDRAGAVRVLKLYRKDIVPKADVLERIKESGIGQIIRLFEYGEAGGVWYEIQEFAAYGSLRSHLSGPVSEETAEECFRIIAGGVMELHAIGILHRDIKPDNILVRSLHPLDLALSDFGISSLPEETLHRTRGARTIRYSAPELIVDGEVMISQAADYWSLGITFVEMLTGRHPFEGMSEAAINRELATRELDLSGVPEGWLTLCRGLLIRDDRKRWGAVEVSRWLDGERDIPVAEDAGALPRAAAGSASGSGGTATAGGKHYPFRGGRYATLPDVLRAFSHHWDEGLKDFMRGALSRWLLNDLADIEAHREIEDLRECETIAHAPAWFPRAPSAASARIDRHERLFAAIARYCPELPPVWKGAPLTEDTLLAMTRNAQGQAVLQEILDRRLLSRHDFITGEARSGALEQDWLELAGQLDEVWDRTIALGAPADKKPGSALIVSSALQALLVPDFIEGARTTVEGMRARGARACAWFEALGPAPAELMVALALAEDALTASAETRGEGRWRLRRWRLILASVTNGLILGVAAGAYRAYFHTSFEAVAAWRTAEGATDAPAGEAAGYAALPFGAIALVLVFLVAQRLYYRHLLSKV